ncbi:MCE family protein [Nocardia jinanensis]|nr:MCE family protein [Nocardia jinanensis]
MNSLKPIDVSDTFRVGIVGLVLTIAAVLSAQNYDRLPLLGAHREYRAHFAEAGGLEVGAPVEVAGVTVGKVTGMELDENKVLVRFSAEGVLVGAESEAAIKTRTVLGSKTLELRPRGDTVLKPDAVIGLEHTTAPYLLTDTLGELTTTISGLKTEDLTGALHVLGDTLDEAEPSLGAALDGVSRLSTSISSRDGLLKDLLSNAAGVTGVLSARSTQINQLILDGSTLFTALDERRQAIDVLLTNLRAAAQQLRLLVAENEAQLAPALDKLNAVVDLLSAHKDDIQRTLLPLSQYALSLGESVASGPFFKAYVSNLLPGQYLQPFIDAAFAQAGVDPGVLGVPSHPIDGGDDSPRGTIPPTGTAPGPNGPVPHEPPPPGLPIPGLPIPDLRIPGLPIPGMGG